MLAHLDAAYGLARHLLRDDDDAADAVQESVLRALRYFAGFRGGSGRAWLLAIVRRTCWTLLRRDWPRRLALEFDEEHHGMAGESADPEVAATRRLTADAVGRALAALPARLREVVVLRELEGLSYKEIAAIVRTPIGTVMSRLARGRGHLARALGGAAAEVEP